MNFKQKVHEVKIIHCLTRIKYNWKKFETYTGLFSSFTTKWIKMKIMFKKIDANNRYDVDIT